MSNPPPENLQADARPIGTKTRCPADFDQPFVVNYFYRSSSPLFIKGVTPDQINADDVIINGEEYAAGVDGDNLLGRINEAAFAGDDTLVGDNDANTLKGYGGDDTLVVSPVTTFW